MARNRVTALKSGPTATACDGQGAATGGPGAATAALRARAADRPGAPCARGPPFLVDAARARAAPDCVDKMHARHGTIRNPLAISRAPSHALRVNANDPRVSCARNPGRPRRARFDTRVVCVRLRLCHEDEDFLRRIAAG